MDFLFKPVPPPPPPNTASSSTPSPTPELPNADLPTPPTPTSGGDAAPPNSNDGFFSQLKSNPLFAGGIGIMVLTGGAALAQKSVVRGSTLLRRHLLVTLEIPSRDKSYGWFLHWMSEYQRRQALKSAGALAETLPPVYTAAGILARIRPAPRELAVETKVKKHPNGSISTDFYLVPGTGKHVLNFRGVLFEVERSRNMKMVDLTTGAPWETLALTTLSRNRHIFSELLVEAQSMAQELQEGKTVIYTSWSTEWKPFGQPRKKRPLESVVLAPGVKERIVDDIKSFLKSGKWYYERGIPYRRGYLLYGPPGTGKSSFIQALAGHLDYNICLLNLSERGLTDDRLNHLLSNLPERSIALLEDCDAAFGRKRVQTEEDGYRGANVTFSGLLNALDGVASSEERIIMLTTNHVDRLDDALVRPGRVDFRIEIGYATPEVVDEMWERFYGATMTGDPIPEEEMERRRDMKKALLRRLGEKGAFGGGVVDGGPWGISTASLQGLFVFFKDQPERALEEVEMLLPPQVRSS
ncbi:Complex III assembly protein translocase and chaperone [Rhizina undulata]